MSDTTSTEAGKPAEKQLANIVRGTLPKPLVYMIRFNEKGGKEAEVAKKYGTTSGKVADIFKNRNFAYIDESYKPTAEEKAAAVAWLKQVPGYDDVGTDAVVVAVENLETASQADVDALTAKRADVRAKNAAAGGSQPKATGGKKAKGKKAETATQEDADALME